MQPTPCKGLTYSRTQRNKGESQWWWRFTRYTVEEQDAEEQRVMGCCPTEFKKDRRDLVPSVVCMKAVSTNLWQVCFAFLKFSEISSWTLFLPLPSHTYLVSEVGLRSCPVVRGLQSLHDGRVVDADLMAPTQGILLRPDHIWTDEVSDQPPWHIGHLKKKIRTLEYGIKVSLDSTQSCVSIFATRRQVERVYAQDRASRTIVTEPHWGTCQRIQGGWAHSTHLKPTSVNTQLKGTSMQNRVTNFRCLIRTKKLLQVQYH